ncbi:MAG: glutamine amidotransferase [Frankiales bacterium]|jgi:putative glutamine amidotransferase|nr:glutamine amidotransferase [Frankiales bacterium]
MRRPVIGITTYREPASWGVWRRPADLLGAGYADAVLAAGGAPVLVPPLAESALDVLGALEGLVLAGGADLDPSRYDAAPEPSTGAPRPDRDATELRLAAACLDGGIPLLAICRGMQVLNVALGGDLVQHLPDVEGAAAHRGSDGVFVERSLDVDPASLLGAVVGAELDVHCYHHQAVGRLGTGLRAVAWSEDGLVEALELEGAAAFLLAVQSHPEESADRRLFERFVSAAARRPTAGGALPG